jgi:hypothetical protein
MFIVTINKKESWSDSQINDHWQSSIVLFDHL